MQTPPVRPDAESSGAEDQHEPRLYHGACQIEREGQILAWQHVVAGTLRNSWQYKLADKPHHATEAYSRPGCIAEQ